MTKISDEVRKYMSDLGKKTSEAKKKAARENGKKGGWPKGRSRKKEVSEIKQIDRIANDLVC